MSVDMYAQHGQPMTFWMVPPELTTSIEVVVTRDRVADGGMIAECDDPGKGTFLNYGYLYNWFSAAFRFRTKSNW